jgi:glycosyltransferase involved in cell wall biosynthesis
MALISIITPTHKRNPIILERCFISVERQTYDQWEHLVVADGGDLNAKNMIIVGNNDKRSYHEIERRGGYGAAVRQAALDKAKGKYLVFLDDDNIIFPTFLEKMISALESAKDDEKFAICQMLHFGPVQPFLGPPPIVLEGIPKMYHIDTLQIMIDKEAFMSVGWQGNDYFSDGRTYEMLGSKFKYVKVPEVLCVHL